MDKNSPSSGSNTRLLIEHGHSLLLHLGQRCIDILHFESDMKEALAALFQEPGQAGIGRGRLDQFDLASPGATEG